eukprot:g623.t1
MFYNHQKSANLNLCIYLSIRGIPVGAARAGEVPHQKISQRSFYLKYCFPESSSCCSLLQGAAPRLIQAFQVSPARLYALPRLEFKRFKCRRRGFVLCQYPCFEKPI